MSVYKIFIWFKFFFKKNNYFDVYGSLLFRTRRFILQVQLLKERPFKLKLQAAMMGLSQMQLLPPDDAPPPIPGDPF